MLRRSYRLNDPLRDAKAKFYEELKDDPVKADRFARLKARTRAFERQRYVLDRSERMRLISENRAEAAEASGAKRS